jgi:hypothetical protein
MLSKSFLGWPVQYQVRSASWTGGVVWSPDEVLVPLTGVSRITPQGCCGVSGCLAEDQESVRYVCVLLHVHQVGEIE